jgi:hypothetical protein
MTVEKLVWQCICRVAKGQDAVTEIGQLCKEYESLMKGKEESRGVTAPNNWFTEGKLTSLSLISFEV